MIGGTPTAVLRVESNGGEMQHAPGSVHRFDKDDLDTEIPDGLRGLLVSKLRGRQDVWEALA
jgi:hypothetical protein